MTDHNPRRCPFCGGYLTAEARHRPLLRRCIDCDRVYDPEEGRRQAEAAEVERLSMVTFRE